jgi:hypothetical protein
LTGDLAMRDADGYFWFVGRADDVIKSAGHLIGPFEVESALMEHPAVGEAGVIGKPDPVAGEIVTAFISLKCGYIAGEPLARELLGHARKRLGPAVAPKEIAFRPDLPRNAKWQDHAPPAARPRIRSAGGRPIDLGRGAVNGVTEWERALATLLGHSASHSERLFLPHNSHSLLGQGRLSGVESSINAERASEDLRASGQLRKLAI